MCTVIVSIQPGRNWPLHVAANRDEKLGRPWSAPDRHWREQPDVFGPLDHLGGGTWLAINDAGVVAGVLNRSGSLGPTPGKRTRGELPLYALKQKTAADAARHICTLDAGAYRTFNLLIADRTEAYYLCGLGYGQPEARLLDPGVHMIATGEPDDIATPRIARHLPRFRIAAPPEPGVSWSSWTSLLADRSLPAGSELNIPVRSGYGTTNSSVIAVGDTPSRTSRWVFAAGSPDRTSFVEQDLSLQGHSAAE